jgi:hypothetical protein
MDTVLSGPVRSGTFKSLTPGQNTRARWGLSPFRGARNSDTRAVVQRLRVRARNCQFSEFWHSLKIGW